MRRSGTQLTANSTGKLLDIFVNIINVIQKDYFTSSNIFYLRHRVIELTTISIDIIHDKAILTHVQNIIYSVHS